MTGVSVIGLGKLGICMAAAIADKGHVVTGVDIVPETIQDVNNGVAPVIEPQLQEYMDRNRNRLIATDSYQDAIDASEISFIVVPTPSDERGYFSIRYAQLAFKSVGAALENKSKYHTVVLTSTVLPGATRNGCLPLLARESQKRPGKDFGVCYSPEFIALGSVIRDFLNPDILLIGEYDGRSGGTLSQFYRTITENKPEVKRMSIENAELAKIGLNTYITTKITFANFISAVCERIPGGDCDVVLDAIGADSRVGKKYLRGGLGYGGPCFPRDNIALSAIAKDLGVTPKLALAVDAVNDTIPSQIASSMHKYLTGASRILILGTSYKPGSPLTEESQAFELSKLLAREYPIPVDTWDPLAQCTLAEKPVWSDYTHIIIANNDPAFKELKPGVVDAGTVIIDLWRSHPEFEDDPRTVYIPHGRCRSDQIATMRLVRGTPYDGY